MSPHARTRAVAATAVGLFVALLLGTALRDRVPLRCDDEEGVVAISGRTPPRIDYGRCESVVERDGEIVCIFDPQSSFHLWVAHPQARDAVVRVDGSLNLGTPYAVEDQAGQGFELDLPAAATRLEVCVPGAATFPWTLEVLARDPGSNSGPEAAAFAVTRAMEEHFSEGDDAKGLEVMEIAFERAMQADRLSDAVDVVLVASNYLSRSSDDPAVVESLFERVEPIAQRYPRGEAEVDAYRGTALWRYGRLGEAAESLRNAGRLAIRLQDPLLVEEALLYGTALSELGYDEAASRWVYVVLDLVRRRSHPCHLVSALRTVGWLNLILRQQGRPHSADPRESLEEALELVEQGVCGDVPKEAGALVGLAEVALDDGDAVEARRLLERVVFEDLTFDERLIARDLEVRILLARKEPAMVLDPALKRLEKEVSAGPELPRSHWYLAMRQGDVHDAAGELELAASAYQRAEDHLDELVQWASFGVGRSTLGERYHDSVERLVESLVRLGRGEQALCAAREARARLVAAAVVPDRLPAIERRRLRQRVERYTHTARHVAAVRRWGRQQPRDGQQSAERFAKANGEALRLEINRILSDMGQQAASPSCDELNPQQSGELLMGLFPGRAGWFVFTREDDATIVNPLTSEQLEHLIQGPSTLEQLLSSSQIAAIDRARRIRVSASGDARDLAVHLLSWQGRELLASRSVVYGAEVWYRTPDPWPREPRAVLLADPTLSLPGARREVDEVRQHLGEMGWGEVTIIEPEHAWQGNIENALRGVQLAHIAAHADYDDGATQYRWPPYAGGTRGWASYIQLLPPARIAAHDILLLPDVPDVVVLQVCKSGMVDQRLGGPSLTLAFLAAGASTVVAAPGLTEDLVGMELGRRIYEGAPLRDSADVVEATRRAQWSMLLEGAAVGPYRTWVQ